MTAHAPATHAPMTERVAQIAARGLALLTLSSPRLVLAFFICELGNIIS